MRLFILKFTRNLTNILSMQRFCSTWGKPTPIREMMVWP